MQRAWKRMELTTNGFDDFIEQKLLRNLRIRVNSTLGQTLETFRGPSSCSQHSHSKSKSKGPGVVFLMHHLHAGTPLW